MSIFGLNRRSFRGIANICGVVYMMCRLLISALNDLVASQLSVTSHVHGTAKLLQRCKIDGVQGVSKLTRYRAT
jgi:hypothetical protein